MFSDLQDKVVSALDTKRQAATDEPGRLIPKAVRPYGGEALQPKQLIQHVPACYVEFDVGRMEAIDYGEVAGGAISFDVLCCTQNYAGPEAEYSDGVALLTWTFEALVGLEVQIEGVGTAYWETMDVGRMMSGKDLWMAKVSPDLQLQRH